MNKITTCLWFENQAGRPRSYYASVFRNAEVGEVIKRAGRR